MSDGRYERELVRIFASAGYAPIRGAASGGGTERELPDVFVGDGEHVFAVELKARDPPEGSVASYGPLDDLDDLTYFAEAFDAEPLIAVRWKGSGGRAVEWRFTWPGQFETTEQKFKWYYEDRDEPYWLTFADLPGGFDANT
jgi:Holliday junction resolvase